MCLVGDSVVPTPTPSVTSMKPRSFSTSSPSLSPPQVTPPLANEVCRRGISFGLNVSDDRVERLRSKWCNATNPGLHQPSQCYSRVQNLFTMNQVGTDSSRAHSFGTRPAWVFFQSAETSCFKQVVNEIWYFQDQCTRKEIVDKVLSSP